MGRYFDGVEKIHFVHGRPDLAFSITGHAHFLDPPPPGTNLRLWLQNAPRRFDADSLTSGWLSQSANRPIEPTDTQNVGHVLGDALEHFFADFPLVKPHFLGKELCRLVIVQFREDLQLTIIAGAAITISEEGALGVKDPLFHAIQQTDTRIVARFGETDYLTDKVLYGMGVRFLPADVQSFLLTPALVRATSSQDAARTPPGPRSISSVPHRRSVRVCRYPAGTVLAVRFSPISLTGGTHYASGTTSEEGPGRVVTLIFRCPLGNGRRRGFRGRTR
jgi:hypothetical protein